MVTRAVKLAREKGASILPVVTLDPVEYRHAHGGDKKLPRRNSFHTVSLLKGEEDLHPRAEEKVPRRHSFHTLTIPEGEEVLKRRAEEKVPPKNCLQALHILKAVENLEKIYPIITFVGTASLFFLPFASMFGVRISEYCSARWNPSFAKERSSKMWLP